MSLLQQIKQASIEARKTKNQKALFLVTLYSEAMMVGKSKRNGESTDEEVIQTLKKFKVGAETMIDAAIKLNKADAQTYIDNASDEISIIEQFLPRMLSESELRKVLVQYFYDLGGGKTERDPRLQMGNFMSQLKKEYPGLYDGALASKLVKELLN